MASASTKRKSSPSPNGAPTLTPRGHYEGRPDIVMSRTVTVIGSRHGSRLHLASSTVSKAHAIIVNTNAGAYIHDLASRTGVFVNGEKVREADLSDGDKVQIGKFKFRFNAGLPPVHVPPGQSAPAGMFDRAQRAALIIDGAEMPIGFDDRCMLIGRRATSDIPLLEDTASTAHAVIYELNGKRFIRDLGSRTGTFVEGRKIGDQAELPLGSEIKIGETVMRYDGQAAVEEDELEHLVGTAPLGEALDLIVRSAEKAQLKPAEPEAEPAAVEPEEADVTPETAEAEPGASDAVPAAGDQIELEEESGNDRDAADTHALPPEPQPKLPAVRHATLAKESDDAADLLAVEESAGTLDAPGEDNLVEMRRGWRGMTPKDAPAEVDGTDASDEPSADAPLVEEQADETPSEVPSIDDDVADLEVPLIAAESIEVEDEERVEQADSVGAIELTDTPEPMSEDDVADLMAGVEPTADELKLDLPTTAELEADEAITPVEDLTLAGELEVDDSNDLRESISVDELSVIDLTPSREDEDEAALSAIEAPLGLEAEPETASSAEAASETEVSSEAEAVAPVEAKAEIELPIVADEPSSAEPLVVEDTSPVVTEPIADETATAGTTGKRGKKAKAKKPAAPRKPRRKKSTEVEPDVVPAPEVAPEQIVAPEPEPIETFEPAVVAREAESEPEPIASEATSTDEPLTVDGNVSPATEAPELAEVLELTEPSPESALDFEDEVARMLSEPADAPEPATMQDADIETPVSSELTDTTFGRAVESFVGESTGPLVEEREAETVDDLANLAITQAPANEAGMALNFDDDAALDAIAAVPEAEASEAAESFVESAPIAETPADQDAELDEDLGVRVSETAEEGTAFALDLEAEIKEDTEAVANIETETATADTREVEAMADADAPPTQQPDIAASEPAAPPSIPTAPDAGSPVTWGPNQEQFLGGRPLHLGTTPPRPRRSASFGSVPVGPPADDHDDTSAAARAPDQSAAPGRPVGWTGAGNTGDIGATIPPYSGKQPKRGQVTTGFDGLAMPPVREMDVFSAMSFPSGFGSDDVVDDVFGGKRPARSETVPVAKRAATGENAAKTSPQEDVWSETDDALTTEAAPARRPRPSQGRTAPPPVYPAATDLPNPPRPKRRWFGLRSLLLMMLIAMTLSAAGIYLLVPIPTTVEAVLRFNRFDALTRRDQQDRLEEQKELLNGQNVAQLARENLRNKYPGISAGFLNDARQMAILASSAAWDRLPNGNLDGALRLRVAKQTFGYEAMREKMSGNSAGIAEPNRKRLHSLTLALYQANGKQTARAETLKQEVASLTSAHAAVGRQVEELKADIERRRAGSARQANQATIPQLQAQAAALEKTWIASKSTLNDLKAEVERLQSAMPAEPQPAGTAQQPVVADEEVAKMEADLKSLNAQVAAAREARLKKAEDARAALDATMKLFEEEVASADGAAQDQPQLQSYVAAAQKLQKPSRELTDQLIHRQEEHNTQLNELKSQMVETMESRRADAWEKDPELREMNDQLAITTRKYNVAVAGNYKAEAEDLKAKIGLLEQTIQAQQTLVGDDQFYTDAIDAIDKLIAGNLKKMEDDRKAVELKLRDEQQTFAQAQPAIEQLPADQKEVATKLKSRLAEVNEARQAFYDASDAANASADTDVQRLEAGATAMSTQIADRRKKLAADSARVATAQAEQERVATLKTREAELAGAQEAEQKAEAAWSASSATLREAQGAVSSARQAGDRLDELARQLDTLQQDYEQKGRDLAMKQDALEKMVEPLPPPESDVRATRGEDPRLLYTVITMVGVVAVFATLILLTAGRQSPVDADDQAQLDEPDSDLVDRMHAPAEPGGAADPNDNGNAHPKSYDAPQTPDDARKEDESHQIA